jgi:CheY-like chemotaxis protein
MNATRILLADEDDEFLEILQSFLFDRGYQCEVTHSGLECLALLRRFAPDLLVLDNDLLWGGADGVLSRMWEEPCLRRIPVIFTSGERAETRSQSLNSSPVVTQLVKPFSLRQLLAAIHAAGQPEAQEVPA